MSEVFHIVPEAEHNDLVSAVFSKRSFLADEVSDVAKACADAARHGIRTHHALKAIHLDDRFGSLRGGCVPGAQIAEIPSRFSAAKAWNANRKSGPSVAYKAVAECIRMADQYGLGMVNVDNCFHYFWGGAYVLEAAQKGYVAYTQCTALLAEVVPFGGTLAALGTNPHTWAFPTTNVVGFPILADFATSCIAMGRVQQLQREGKRLPEGSAVDADGRLTDDPAAVAALLPFGKHKGYGLGLVNELVAAYIGGWLPTLRGRPDSLPEKNTTCFHFMVIHPEALNAGGFSGGRSAGENVRAVIGNILRKGNDSCLLPGEIEAKMASVSAKAGGLLFTSAEMKEFGGIAQGMGIEWSTDRFATVEL